ncbi:MAG: UxaA family hydrolase [Gemmatimonadetes bacterium]|jgi:altronate dehydratase|nr:UxaA family hydrolase [Gemmatimonadota bacterium]MBT6148677.1 UxaA family hydrolase [Gemmatimonadota bacterium]
MTQRAILLNEQDDVATALTALGKAEKITVKAGERSVEVTLQEEVPFGHKYALRDIAAGEDVLKYGLPIGQALNDVKAGSWVHVHNCRSDRFGHRHQKYGVNA